ncbi:MAG: DUF4976 domain-containing protein [Gemmataceae bacterium]|nr:DUF4976 domain-containing protein [Gemmataceae bacterium]
MQGKSFLTLAAIFFLTSGLQAEAPKNIILLQADDLKWNVLGYAGDKLAKTPNLDALAQKGIVFKNHFVTTSICCVSRATLFTGQYEKRHQIKDFATPFSPEALALTYPGVLKKAGYRTGFIGKFGVGDAKYIASLASQFDYYKGLPGQAGQFFIDPNNPKKAHTTARFGDQALEFLDGCSNDKPFCLSISFNAPHARDGKPREFQPDLRDEEQYAQTVFPLPKTTQKEFFDRLPDFVKTSEARRRWKLRYDGDEMTQKTFRDYYRLVMGIDREVGRIVAKAKEKNLLDNTLLIFTADNGFFLGDRGLADKWFLYEESIRVPMLLAPLSDQPFQKKSVEALTLNIDVAPTILHWAGLPRPDSMQGKSLLPLALGGQEGAWRNDFFYEHHFRPEIIPSSEGVRNQRFKYIRWTSVNPVVEEMYDLQTDPLEEKNLVGEETAKEMLGQLRQRWQTLSAEVK